MKARLCLSSMRRGCKLADETRASWHDVPWRAERAADAKRRREGYRSANRSRREVMLENVAPLGRRGIGFNISAISYQAGIFRPGAALPFDTKRK